MPLAGGDLHQPVCAVPLVEPERLPHQQQGSGNTEPDAKPLIDPCHIEDDKDHKDGKQAARKNE